MTSEEIRKWVTENVLHLHDKDKIIMLRDKINELITIAMEDGKVPGWIISNMMTNLSEKHGYR
jgi:hypothetical protein